MKLKAVKGTRDLRGEDIRRLRYLLESADRIFPLYGYEEIKTPIMEKTELFTHSVGQNTDIVGKEMYVLEDRRGRSLALRPEGTAPVVRSTIINNLTRQNKFLRFFLFRAYVSLRTAAERTLSGISSAGSGVFRSSDSRR